LGREGALALALNGGDDYELCFTAPQARRAAVLQAATATSCAVTAIGVIEKQRGLRCFDRGRAVTIPDSGYDHFRL
jgi:thiamine-monophosphate kinase